MLAEKRIIDNEMKRMPYFKVRPRISEEVMSVGWSVGWSVGKQMFEFHKTADSLINSSFIH